MNRREALVAGAAVTLSPSLLAGSASAIPQLGFPNPAPLSFTAPEPGGMWAYLANGRAWEFQLGQHLRVPDDIQFLSNAMYFKTPLTEDQMRLLNTPGDGTTSYIRTTTIPPKPQPDSSEP